jgi:hypothetical protein
MHMKKLVAAMMAVGLATLAAEDAGEKKDEKITRVEVTGSSLKRINAKRRRRCR